ncbi:uncharacterized protein LOC115694346 [Syzygium oleosum]|uniref:uncharacterized protein LOC115694346 n=1 Tax=Syzygium oleosum TaxID=219896 RepID=UPI0024B9369E|nr:uncharacterized protein LOC115694346 [Syzygium oleosum]
MTREFLPRIWVSLSRQPTEKPENKAEIVKAVLFQLGVEEEVGDIEAKCTSVDHKLNALVALLHTHLWGKKYLIVLDGVHDVGVRDKDVCDEGVPDVGVCDAGIRDNGVCNASNEWYSNLGSSLSNGGHWGHRLVHGLPKGYGRRVIVTCRNEEMARKMVGEDNLHRIMLLSNTEICWEIFENSAKQQEKQIDSTKEELKQDIKNKCAGLPLIRQTNGSNV